MEILRNSGVAHEFRTLILGNYFDEHDIDALSLLVDTESNWTIRKFRSVDCLENWNGVFKVDPLKFTSLTKYAEDVGKESGKKVVIVNT